MVTVPFRNEGGGRCVEIGRDETSWAAQTLCGMVIMLPEATGTLKPTCAECIKRLAKKKVQS